MPSFLVLDNNTITDIFLSLSKDDILKFKHAFETTIREFILGAEGSLQPQPNTVVRPEGGKTLFRPFTGPKSVGVKIVTTPPPRPGEKLPLGGIITLSDENGVPSAIFNAAEITGFRTSLSALIPWYWRKHTEHIVVLGAGKQALWHTRLALALRGDEIKSITIYNRSQDRAQELLQTVQADNDKCWKSAAKLAVFDSSLADSDEKFRLLLTEADAIFCTLPTTTPLFKVDTIFYKERKRLPYISAIGSWTPDMTEIGPDVLRKAVETEPSFNPTGGKGSVVLSDDVHEATLKAGELVNSDLTTDELLNVGQVIDWLRGNGDLDESQRERLNKWLAEGFVVLKGIGISTTDLTSAEEILRVAKERGLGTPISSF
jgi:ornithine cyclodeaminase/alanine dehydrogenase-like protein (mu-crystallin family)